MGARTEDENVLPNLLIIFSCELIFVISIRIGITEKIISGRKNL